jgi:hypothetical protein
LNAPPLALFGRARGGAFFALGAEDEKNIPGALPEWNNSLISTNILNKYA